MPAAVTTPGPATGGAPSAAGVAGFDEVLSANVILVTGKGGVGKTTVAATIALAAVAAGRATLAVEVEGRHSLSRALEASRWDYEEREFRPGLWGTALDPAEAVLEYLELFYGLRRIQWVMERSHALDFVTTAAPGLRDLLLVGKIYEIEARRRADGRRRYDTIVVDAPPTGRIVEFLLSPRGATEIVRVGPIRRQSGRITEMLSDPARCQVVVVTLCEEMPVSETLEGVEALSEAGLRVGPVVANQVETERVTTAERNRLERMSRSRIAALASVGHVTLDDPGVDRLRQAASDHRERLAVQDEMLQRLAGADLPTLLQLPTVAGRAMDLARLVELADELTGQLAVADHAAS